MEILQPGCQGVLTNYKSVPRERIKAAYEFLMKLEDGVVAGDHEGGAPPMGDELFDVEEEFGGQEMGHDPNHEGGGDYDRQQRDEL